MIQHIWFDFSDTLAMPNEHHRALQLKTYAAAVSKEESPALMAEFDKLRDRVNSKSAVFRSLGLPRGYWSKVVNDNDPASLYSLADESIPRVLAKLRESVLLSIFSNMRMDILLPGVGIDPALFTHFISSEDIANPKPALDGFQKLVELSNLPAKDILFVGDGVAKEMLPAKEVGLTTCLMWDTSEHADYSFNKFEDLLTVLG
tara:strand:- start:21 stop:629 length:609 start_codon:yes stop_codon:yes gene_type:complete